MARRSVLAAALGAVVLTASMAWAQTPTLGELSKKEQERRKALQTPAKVLNPDVVPRRTPPPAVPAAQQPPATGEQKPAEKPEKPEDPQKEDPQKDEAWWRARMAQAREDLRRSEMFAEALQTRINSLTNDFASRDDPYQRARIGEDRVKALAELERVKAEIELHKKKIDEIEEEARRAGVPPGWLR
ncbi:MAG TPA: hypothetical protein VM364_22805 [Vicinamibacterales bacterium]|nr:hypothetical protein [Vicinamibacterales bacterium]